MNDRELLNQAREMKEKISRFEAAKHRFEGELKSAHRRLKDDFDISSLKEAEKKMTSLRRDIKNIEEKYLEAVEELKGVMDLIDEIDIG